ncbi:MAG: transglutaminase family protein [Planctomycetaceae bacterium]
MSRALMRYRITHITRYTSGDPVSVGQNQAWLRPRVCDHQQVLRYRLKIDPPPSVQTERNDAFGNPLASFAFNEGYRQLTVTARGTVEVLPRPEIDPERTMDWETQAGFVAWPATADDREALQFRFESPRIPLSPALREFAEPSFPAGRPVLAGALDLTARIYKEFEYKPQSTTVNTAVSDVLKQRKGVCQDFAHLQIAALRSIGLAARYVSGYLRTTPPPGKPRLVGADATHAWLAVYCGPAGWVDLDPTNNVIPGTDHITLAWGRDYSDVPPLKGVFIGGGEMRLEVSVDVEPLEDAETGV